MIGVLLVNLGTPRAPTTKEVRKYLREFLSDPRVIDIAAIPRWLLVNLIIAPFRGPKSAKAYQKVWTDEGSPLMVYTKRLTQAVREKLGEEFQVEMAMRYEKPDVKSALEKFQQSGVQEIRVLPLYPQYSSSATGSVQEKIFQLAQQMWNIPPIRFLLPFFDHPGFVNSFAEIGRPQLEKFQPDHILFSFHGLPERQILKGDLSERHCLQSDNCCEKIIPANALCYRAHCFASARAIAKKLLLDNSQYTICFQSRLGRTPWIRPFTDHVIEELAQAGKKRVAVFCPSFVADCLETLEEISIRAHEQFLQAGGDALQLIPSLNDHPVWVDAVVEMIRG